jgi:hypothetical protein
VSALAAGELLPGAAVDGVGGVPLQPWLGRRHDPKLGFGRRLSQAVLVRSAWPQPARCPFPAL